MPKRSFPYDGIDFRLIKKLRKYILKHNIDLVHAHFADEGLHAMLAVRGTSAAWVQGWAVDFRINRRIDNVKFRLLGRYAHASVALTNVLLLQARAYGADPKHRGVVIHNGIDPSRVTGSSQFRNELPAGINIAGMIGNFYNNVRDQPTICKALAHLLPKHPDWHFVFVGGHTNRWIKNNHSHFLECVAICESAGIKDRVHFLGLRKDTANILGGLDVYVHATNFDTFGIAPVEAMLNGLPVVANDHPVFLETSGNGEGMELFAHKNVEDLIRVLEPLLLEENKRQTLGEKHRAHAFKHFHIDVHVQNMKALYQSILTHA